MAAHTLASCPIPGPAHIQLAALGDFPTTNIAGETLALDAVGTKLSFPVATLAHDALATVDSVDRTFLGYGERFQDRLDFLLWPEGSACELFEPSQAQAFPGKLGGEGLGYASTSGLVMIAGSNDATGAAIVGALTFDTRTGESYVVDPRARAVLSEPRAFATVTDFAGQIVVAGGEDPIHDASEPASVLRKTAEIYDPATRSFEPTLVQLTEAVTRHAAANLDSGETVLLGGRSEASDASSLVQVISPATRISKLVGELNVGRDSPSALRLSDGRIFVGGGEDAAGQPIGALEWRASDASPLDAPFAGSVSLPARFGRAFAPLAGGAVLAVGGCQDREPAPGEDCSTWCTRGCPPLPDGATRQGYDAFWIGPQGSVSALNFPLTAPAPVLLPGSDGRPWLVAAANDDHGQAIAGSYALYRFDPWAGQFELIDFDLGLTQALDPPRFVATGLDAFVWLSSNESGPVIQGARFGARSAFSSEVEFVSLHDSDNSTRPAHLAPDQPPGAKPSYDSAASTLVFAKVEAADPKGCVWITDAEYADFSASIEFTSDDPPVLRVGTYELSDPSSSNPSSPCTLPAKDASLDSGRVSVTVQRTGEKLTTRISSATISCDIATGRLPIGVCSSDVGPVTVTRISVKRGH